MAMNITTELSEFLIIDLSLIVEWLQFCEKCLRVHFNYYTQSKNLLFFVFICLNLSEPNDLTLMPLLLINTSDILRRDSMEIASSIRSIF